MRALRWVLSFYILGLFSPVAGSSQAPDQENLITVIAISGLTKTKRSVAEMPLLQFLGQPGDKLNLDAVYAAVKDTGILEPLSVSVEENPQGEGKVLAIEVREKWSLFPVPIIYLKSGYLNYGGFLVDTNAFGLKDQFFLGGIYGAAGWRVGGGYIHTYGGSWFPGWLALTFFSREERHDKDQQDKDLRVFKLDSVMTIAGINYPFWEIFKWSLTGHFREKTLPDFANPLKPPKAGIRMLGIGTELLARKTYWDGFLLSEQSALARYIFMGGLNGPSYHSLVMEEVYERSLIPGFRLNSRIHIVYEPEVPIVLESASSAAGVNILPGSFLAQNLVGASLGLEKYLIKLPLGTISALAAYQGVYSYNSVLGHSFDHGVAAAVFFYLSRLAIPTVKVGIAYNLAAQYVQAYFSVGVQF